MTMKSRTTSRIGLVAAFVLILVCVSVFTLSAPVAAEEEFTADRTDVDTVTVSLDPDTDANLSITDPEGVDWSTSWNTETDKEIDLSDIHSKSDPDLDLTEATIQAEFADEGTATATVALHQVSYDTTHTSWVSDDELHVPLDSEATFGTGDTILLSIDDETNIDGFIQDGQSLLTIPHDELTTATSVQSELSLSPTVEGERVSVGSEISLEPDLRTIDQTQHLYHPAFADGASYNLTGLDIEGNPDDALIDVSSAPIGESHEFTFADENISDLTVDQRAVPDLSGTGTVGESVLDVDGLPAGLSSATVLIVDDDGTLTELDTAEISSVQLDDESFDSPEHIVLQTSAGLFEITSIDWSDSEDEDSDGSFLGIEFGFYHGAFFGVVVAGLLSGLGSYFIFGRQQGHSFEFIFAIILWAILTGVFIIVLAILVEVDILIEGPDISTVGDFFLLVGIALVGGVIGMISYAAPTYVWTGSSTTSQKCPLKFRVTQDGQPVNQGVTIKARPIKGSSSAVTRTFDLSQSTTPKLQPGTWEFTVLYGSNDFPAATTQEKIPSRTSDPYPVSIAFKAAAVQIGVVDKRTEQPIQHGEVQFEAAGQSETKTLNDGAATYDPPRQASSVTVHISCEKYESRTLERDIAETDWPVVESLTPKLGGLDITSTIADEQIGNMSVEIIPDEQLVQQMWKRTNSTDPDGIFKTTTDTNGSYSIDRRDETTPPLFAGSYTVRLHPPETNNQYFREDEQTVQIKNRQKSRITLSVPFTWSIDQYQRRIEDLRSEVENLSSQTHRDVAIPQYFGTVMLSALDAVEQIPDQGHLFSEHNIDPDEAVEAILTATDELTHVVDNAMSTKRNVDLFSACSNLPEADVQWDGSFSLPDVLDRSNQSLATSRSSFAEELEDTSDLIKSERQELTELSPVKELHSRISDNAPSSHGDDNLEAVVMLYLSELLLDAIKQAFDEPDLRKRLDQTVF